MGRAEWTGNADEEVLVGVVGAEEIEVPTDERAAVVRGDVDAVLERSPAFVVCVGERSLSSVARAADAVPVLPVDVGDGLWSTDVDRLPAALEAILENRATERRHPVLTVEADVVDESTRAVFDVTLVTAEPARISEYSVASRGETVAQFRADGVVVATPQGSHGYASAAGGPLVSSALDAVAAVPVAPFVTQTRQWILPDDDVELAVERDEGPVALQVDDRALGTIDPDAAVSITAGEPLRVLVPDGTDAN